MPHEGITLPQVGRPRPAHLKGHGALRDFSAAIMGYMTQCVRDASYAPTYETLAAECAMSTVSLQTTLRHLEHEGLLIREVRPSLFRYVVRDVGSTLWTPPGRTLAVVGKDTQQRKCLCCGKGFWSSHRGNRLCQNCKS